MPGFQFDKAFRIARRIKTFLRHPKNALRRRLSDPENVLGRKSVRNKKREVKQVRTEIKSKRREEYKELKNKISKIENELKGKKKETKRTAEKLRAVEDPAQISEYEQRKKRIQRERSRLRKELRATKKKAREVKIGRKRNKKKAQQELFLAQRELAAATEQRVGTLQPGTGTLPDFVIIGAKKGGTTFLYHLLGQHPLVEPAAKKELHFFDVHFELGIEWYRRCFPVPRGEDGRRTITGEGTPYMSHPFAPERMAEVVPQARLIALLRNPVERAYSDYQQAVRHGRETRTFEEAIGAAEQARSSGTEHEHRAVLDRHGYLSRSVYVNQLLHWSEFFRREQMLVLKSEDFFERPQQTLQSVLEFLGLPEWEPEASETRKERKKRDKRNVGGYEGGMDPVTRKRLEEYFEPHNKGLYDYLGVDFGW